jgi:hypothetical protein
MAAPSIAELLDYESNLEDALVAYFGARFPAWQVLTDRTTPEDEQKLETPRIEIAVSQTGSGTAEHQAQNRPDKAYYESQKLGTLSIRAVARRPKTDQSLGTMRGQLREAMLPETLALTPVNVPYYEITHVAESSSVPAFFAGNDEIQCELSWDIAWFIKPDAWPLS